MKKNENIMARVEQYKYKRGISYNTVDGSLYHGWKIFGTLCFIYYAFFAAMYFLAQILALTGAFGKGYEESIRLQFTTNFLPVAIATVITITGYVLTCLKKTKLAGCIAVIVGAVAYGISILSIIKLMKLVPGPEDNWFLGIPGKYYFYNFIPALLLVLSFGVLLSIDISARIKTNKVYNTVVENLYEKHSQETPDGITDSEWQAILSKSGAKYDKQFKEQEEK